MALQNQFQREQLALHTQNERDRQALHTQSEQNRLAIQREEGRTRELGFQKYNSVMAASVRHRMTSEELAMQQRAAVGMFRMDQIRRGTEQGQGQDRGQKILMAE